MNISAAVNVTQVLNSPLAASPVAPAPSNPFTSLSNVGLAAYLDSNFERFITPGQPGVISRATLEGMANSSTAEGRALDDAVFALTLLENEGIMEQVGQGGRISHESVTRYVQLSNGSFSRQSNIELTRHLLNNFKTFSEPHLFHYGEVASVVTRQSLEKVKHSTTSSGYTNDDRKFASELLARTSLLSKILDGLGGSGFDNMISHTVLKEWLILGRRTTI